MNGGILDGLESQVFTITLQDAFELLANNAINILTVIISALFILMFTLGGLYYITSNGNPQRAGAGKKYLTYAIGGLILVIFARIIPLTVKYVGDGISGSGSLQSGIIFVVDFVLSVVGVLAILFIVIGGFKYILSGGNTERTASAKKTITYAVVGLLAVLLSGVVINSIYYFLQQAL